MTVYGRRQQTLLDYDGFVDKFKPRKTTDDCLTPDGVYEAVREWATREYKLEGREIVRPFWPGGDYEMFDYPDNCVVIDNPPFSIISKIVRFYNFYSVDYFLFAPHLTNFGIKETNHIICGAPVTYANGANVSTSFVTSLGEYKIMNAPRLFSSINGAGKSLNKKQLPSYKWPDEVLKATDLGAVTSNGISFALRPEECLQRGNLDNMAKIGKGVFGGCYLISKAAAAKAAAAKAAAAKAAAAKAAAAEEAEVVELSAAERAVVEGLGT